MKLYAVPILLLLSSIVSGQNISGVVNTYHRVTAINTTTNTLTLSSAAGLSPGVKILIIQMKGATIDVTNTAAFGNITTLSTAGNYEFNSVCGVAGNQILLMFQLASTYNVGGLVQVVSVPRYTDAVVTDTLKATPWDPVQGTGGIIAIEASSSITLLAPIDVQGMGFKGGAFVNHPEPPYGCDPLTTVSAFFLTSPVSGQQVGGAKGEGVSTVVATMINGKGKLANGGGGGNNHNTGGGGGGNFGTGGNGGRRTNEGITGCHGQHPGVGGLSMSAYGYGSGANNRVFLGGGGGSGEGNNNIATAGANGGGIIFIKTPSLIGNNQLIRANGERPYLAGHIDPYSSGGDGAGGGGGGGVVALDVTNYSGNVIAQAQGGNGSNSSVAPSPGCFGPGGGGGGGVVWVKDAALNPLVTAAYSGGANGLVDMSAGVVACRGSANFSTPGATGALRTSFVPVIATIFLCAPLPVQDLVYFTGKEVNSLVELNWKMRSVANVQRYEVERSVDNLRYTTVATVVNNNQFNLSTIDKDAIPGYTFYRLKIFYSNGTLLYSPTTTVRIQNQYDLQLMRLSPNPAINKLELVIKAELQGNCDIEIYNSTAQKISGGHYRMRQGVNEVMVPIDHLAAGMYFLHINQHGKRVVRSFVKSGRP